MPKGNTAAGKRPKILKSKAVINGKSTGRRHQHCEGMNTKHNGGKFSSFRKGVKQGFSCKKVHRQEQAEEFL